MTLQRSMTTTGLLFAAIAGIMGSGWLFGPFFAAKIAGPAAILSWVIGGGMMMFVALTFAELASSFPMTGGTARFLQLSHGPLVSFTMAFVAWLSAAAVAPIETMALLQYLTNYVPWLMHQVGSTHLLTLPGMIIAAAIMLVLSAINALGVKLLSKTNTLIVFCKLGIPIIVIIYLLSVDRHVGNITNGRFDPTGIKSIFIALPSAGVIFSFIGYSPAVQLAGEAKNPQRSLPIAIIGALLFCIIIYVALQVTFIASVPASSYAHGWDHLSFAGDTGPFTGLAMALGAFWLAQLIFAGSIIAPFGTALIYTASTARLGYAMGKNGYVPQSLLKLNRFGIPTRILALNYVIGLFLFMPFPTWQKMVGFLVSSLVFAYAVGPLALLALRKSQPEVHRPFKLPAPRLICLIAFYICNLIVYWTGWYIVSKLMIALIVGYCVLALYKQTKAGKQIDLQWSQAWWVFPFIGLTALMSYLGSFGGGLGIIPFGWDFIAVAIITVIIFEFAQKCIKAPEVAAVS